MREYDFINNIKKSFREKYNISLKTINKYLIKYDIPHRRNLNVIKFNRDKNGRFTFGTSIFEKLEPKVFSCCNDSRIDAPKNEKRAKAAITKKVCNSYRRYTKRKSK